MEVYLCAAASPSNCGDLDEDTEMIGGTEQLCCQGVQWCKEEGNFSHRENPRNFMHIRHNVQQKLGQYSRALSDPIYLRLVIVLIYRPLYVSPSATE